MLAESGPNEASGLAFRELETGLPRLLERPRLDSSVDSVLKEGYRREP